MPREAWNAAWVRALAEGYWARGADGMYVFNWHANERGRRPLLTTIGSPATLRRTNKVHAALHRHIREDAAPWTGADLHDRIHGETPVELHPTLSGDGPRFRVPVHESPAHARTVELHIEIDHYTALDKIRVTFDGNQLGPPAVRSAARESSTTIRPTSANRAGSSGRSLHKALLSASTRCRRFSSNAIAASGRLWW